MAKCGKPCEKWSRVVGYFRPVRFWNAGKKAEFHDRKPYSVQERLRTNSLPPVKEPSPTPPAQS